MTKPDNALYAILSVADDDLTALVAAVVHVVEGRHYDQQGAQEEMERVIAQLREAVSNDEAKERWRKPAMNLNRLWWRGCAR